MKNPAKTLQKKPNVLFIVVDCFRKDHLMGKSQAITPFLDLLRSKSTVFTQAISISTTTSPCFSSILTGKYSFKHGVKTIYGYALNPEVKTLAEAFKESGYYTVAEVTGPLIEEVGLNKGFDEYRFRHKLGNTIYSKWGQGLIERINKWKKLDKPLFLFLHLWELHRTRFMAKRFNKRKYGKIAYERALSCLDVYLEKVIEAFGNNSIIVIIGDHGEKLPKNKAEEYFNHAQVIAFAFLRMLGLSKTYSYNESHGFDLSEDLLRIPLLFYGNPFPKGKLIGCQVGQVDAAVTLADLLGVKLDEDIDGRSLMPLVKGKSLPPRAVFIEERSMKIPDKQNWIEGVRTPDWKYICGKVDKNRPEELYYLGHGGDPNRNIAADKPDIVKKMRGELKKLKKSECKETKLDEGAKKKLRDRLKKLGYF